MKIPNNANMSPDEQNERISKLIRRRDYYETVFFAIHDKWKMPQGIVEQIRLLPRYCKMVHAYCKAVKYGNMLKEILPIQYDVNPIYVKLGFISPKKIVSL